MVSTDTRPRKYPVQIGLSESALSLSSIPNHQLGVQEFSQYMNVLCDDILKSENICHHQDQGLYEIKPVSNTSNATDLN